MGKRLLILFSPLDYDVENQEDSRQADPQGKENLRSRAARTFPAPGEEYAGGNRYAQTSPKDLHDSSNSVEFLADFKYI